MARRRVELGGEIDGRIALLFEGRKVSGRARYACVRYLQERRRLTAVAARFLLFDPHEESSSRRMGAVTLLSADRAGAVEDFRALFDSEGAESRLIAIDLLCHYGTADDARKVASLFETGTPKEQARVHYALGLRANAELQPPVPLRPTPEQQPEVRRRLMEWVKQ